MNEKTQTQSGTETIQRDAESSEEKVLKRIARIEHEEGVAASLRGHGGYLNTDEVNTRREAKLRLAKELAKDHPKRRRIELESSRASAGQKAAAD